MAHRLVWKGDEVLEKARRASGAGLVDITIEVAKGGKRKVHVVTGTCQRSIHPAPVGYTGRGDQERAAAGQDLMSATLSGLPSWKGERAVVWCGTWVAYGCVLENRFPYMYPALEEVRGKQAEELLKKAFAKEGF